MYANSFNARSCFLFHVIDNFLFILIRSFSFVFRRTTAKRQSLELRLRPSVVGTLVKAMVARDRRNTHARHQRGPADGRHGPRSHMPWPAYKSFDSYSRSASGRFKLPSQRPQRWRHFLSPTRKSFARLPHSNRFNRKFKSLFMDYMKKAVRVERNSLYNT